MKYIFYISLLISAKAFGQFDAIYSQYAFNQFAVNPAYAGTRDAINVNLVARNQWVGIEGAPQSQNFSMHTPASNYNLAWGVNFAHDQMGPFNNFIGMASISYRLKLENANLHFGLRGGAYNLVLDHGKLNFREENDILDNQTKYSSIVPNFDFGMYYYTEKFYAGLSVNHLTASRYKFDGLDDNLYHLKRQAYFSMGYVFKIADNVLLKPTTLIKYALPNVFNTDVNVNFMFYERFWVGIGTRNLSSANFLVDLYVTDYLRVGYSYDLTLNKLQKFSNGSHEILIGFDFNLKKPIVASPRYL